jgi:hypothetical protein
MNPYNQQGRQTDQPTQGGRPTQRTQKHGQPPMQGGHSQPETMQPPGTEREAPAGPTPIGEMAVDSPTLRWACIEHPEEAVEIGPDDYVLESVFNPGRDAWEVLVLVQPREDEEEDDDD